ncbi:unnamed protein product, partial [Amoebophrya sp. A25]|eukprot:GSA25T00006100001.1
MFALERGWFLPDILSLSFITRSRDKMAPSTSSILASLLSESVGSSSWSWSAWAKYHELPAGTSSSRASLFTRTKITKTSFYDIPGPEQEMDQRPPIFDAQLKYYLDEARNNFERVAMARKSAQMAAHVASLASTAAIAKSHQLAHDVAVSMRRPKFDTVRDDVALLEQEATQKCVDAGLCKAAPAQTRAFAEVLEAHNTASEVKASRRSYAEGEQLQRSEEAGREVEDTSAGE